jgi:hypothetical protein
MIVLPRPPIDYESNWANQFSRALELQMNTYFSQIQGLLLNIAPNYTTTGKNALANKKGQVIFDTDLGKLCVNTGSGWETITSV